MGARHRFRQRKRGGGCPPPLRGSISDLYGSAGAAESGFFAGDFGLAGPDGLRRQRRTGEPFPLEGEPDDDQQHNRSGEHFTDQFIGRLEADESENTTTEDRQNRNRLRQTAEVERALLGPGLSL